MLMLAGKRLAAEGGACAEFLEAPEILSSCSECLCCRRGLKTTLAAVFQDAFYAAGGVPAATWGGPTRAFLTPPGITLG